MTQKDPSSPKGAPFIVPSAAAEFHKISRIWAENGLIRMERREDGQIVNLTLRQAAQRAQALNNMVPEMKRGGAPEDWIRETLRLIERVIAVCNEARTQIAAPNKKTAKVQNLINGCDANGKPLIQALPEDYWITRFSMQYHTLTADEIRVVVRGVPTIQRAQQILATKHRQRMAEQAASPLLAPPAQATEN